MVEARLSALVQRTVQTLHGVVNNGVDKIDNWFPKRDTASDSNPHLNVINDLHIGYYEEADYGTDWAAGGGGVNVETTLPYPVSSGRWFFRKNTNTGVLRIYVYDGVGWEFRTITDAEAPEMDLDHLNDVTIDGTPADNEVLAYNVGSSNWINQTPSEAGLQSVLTFGLAVGNAVQVDQTLVVGEYAKVIGTGLESRTTVQMVSDIGSTEPVTVGSANAIGSATNFSLSDHVHQREHPIFTPAGVNAHTDISAMQDDDTFASATATAIASSESIKALSDANNLIGSANAEYINCHFSDLSGSVQSIPTHANLQQLGLVNAGATNFFSHWMLVGMPLTKNGLDLYISGCRVIFEVVDSNDYVSQRKIYGNDANAGFNTLDTDTALRITKGVDIDTFTAVQIGSVYYNVIVELFHNVTTSGGLRVPSVALLCYYA